MGLPPLREAYPTPSTLHSPPPHDKAASLGTPELSGVGNPLYRLPRHHRHAIVAAITATRATAAVPHSL